MAEGIHTAANKPTWRLEGVTNEKHIGDALLQKICTVDVITKSESLTKKLCLSII